MQNFIKKFSLIILINLASLNLLFAQSEFKEENLHTTPKENNVGDVTKIIDKVKDKLTNNALTDKLQSLEKTKSIKDYIKDLILNKKNSSLMFDKEESASLKEAIDSYYNDPLDPELREKKLKENAENSLEKSEEKTANEIQSNIYLTSILFFNNNNWVVWINGNKISSDANNRDNEIFIKSITKDKAKIIWQMGLSKWKILSGYSAENGDAEAILNKDGKVEFKTELKPNQTFILKSKKVIEGKLKTEDNAVKNIITKPEK